MNNQESRVTMLEERVADIEKHIHGDDCVCPHCMEDDKFVASMKASQELAYKPDFETHPIGTVEGLRAEIDAQKALAMYLKASANSRKEEIDGLRAELKFQKECVLKQTKLNTGGIEDLRQIMEQKIEIEGLKSENKELIANINADQKTLARLRTKFNQTKDWADQLYEVGMDGIDYVGMSNYASRQSEAKEKLRIAYKQIIFISNENKTINKKGN